MNTIYSLVCHFKQSEKSKRFLAPLIITALLIVLLPAAAYCQTSSWSVISISPASYNAFTYIDKTLFESEGKIKIIADTPLAITITVQAATTQNGKTTTSTKKIILDTCTSCFTSDKDGLTYCGLWHAGACWLDRDLGASGVATAYNDPQGKGVHYYKNTANTACPSGWKLPTYSQYEAVFRLALNETSLNMKTRSAGALCLVMYNTPLKFVACGNHGVDYGNDGHRWYDSTGYLFISYYCSSSSYTIHRTDAGSGNYYGVRCVRN